MNGPDSMRDPMMDLDEAARAMEGIWSGTRVTFSGVTTDSRAVRPGDLFVALRGERFDGHAFVGEARTRGAATACAKAWPAGNIASSRGREIAAPVPWSMALRERCLPVRIRISCSLL